MNHHLHKPQPIPQTASPNNSYLPHKPMDTTNCDIYHELLQTINSATNCYLPHYQYLPHKLLPPPQTATSSTKHYLPKNSPMKC